MRGIDLPISRNIFYEFHDQLKLDNFTITDDHDIERLNVVAATIIRWPFWNPTIQLVQIICPRYVTTTSFSFAPQISHV